MFSFCFLPNLFTIVMRRKVLRRRVMTMALRKNVMTMALRMIMMMPTSLASWSAASSSLLCSARSVASLIMIMIRMILMKLMIMMMMIS